MTPARVLLVLLAFGLLAFAMVAICWAASGSPDANGDPERDSGLTDDEIAAQDRAWDRGSAETETRPNLEYARRLNREALRRSLPSA